MRHRDSAPKSQIDFGENCFISSSYSTQDIGIARRSHFMISSKSFSTCKCLEMAKCYLFVEDFLIIIYRENPCRLKSGTFRPFRAFLIIAHEFYRHFGPMGLLEIQK